MLRGVLAGGVTARKESLTGWLDLTLLAEIASELGGGLAPAHGGCG